VGDRILRGNNGGNNSAGADSDASRPPSPREKAMPLTTTAAVQLSDATAASTGSANGFSTAAERGSRTGSNSKAENPSISPVAAVAAVAAAATPPRAAWQEEADSVQKGTSSSSKKEQQQQRGSRLNLSSSVGAHRYTTNLSVVM
jgi:hypothetical protein